MVGGGVVVVVARCRLAMTKSDSGNCELSIEENALMYYFHI